MSCIYKIREGMSSFTETERKIGEYILKYKEEAINLSAQELADRTETSAAAIIRFSKRLGYKGFTTLKVEIAKDMDEVHEDFNDIIKESDSIGTIVKKTIKSNIITLEETLKLINVEVLEEVIKILYKAKNIYLYGVGASGLMALDFQYKLNRIKKLVIYQNDTHIQLASAVHIEPEDVAIGISYSGETKEVNLALKKAKENGAKTIAITSYSKNTLSKIVDIPLYIPNEEKELRIGAISSRMSASVMLDLLYLGLAKVDIESTNDYILKTREIIKYIK